MKYNADHILVKYKYEADDILRLLQNGEAFEGLAQKYSQCSSAKSGGSLGTIDGSRLDADFVEALDLLKIDEISKMPVRTRFGYHIIRRRNP
jgi:peptidyl-prolyl cis-trans isomerase C